MVTSVTFSPDGALVASGSECGRLLVWDWKDEAAVSDNAVLEGGLWPLVAFSEDGTKLFAKECRNNLRIWDVCSRKLLWDSIQSRKGEVTDRSDSEAQAIIDRRESIGRCTSSRRSEGPNLYHNEKHEVVMRREKGMLILAELPPLFHAPLSEAWSYLQEQNLFAALLSNAVRARFRLRE